MDNIAFYNHNLLNILNGGSCENNPLSYFTKDYKNFDIVEIPRRYNNKEILSEYSIDIDSNHNIYTFNRITDNKIQLIRTTIDNTIQIGTQFEHIEGARYSLKIIGNQLWYTKTQGTTLYIYCLDITNDEGLDGGVGTEICEVPNEEIKFKQDGNYIYILGETHVKQYNIQEKHTRSIDVSDISPYNAIDIYDKCFYIIEGNYLKRYNLNSELKLIQDSIYFYTLDDTANLKKYLVVDNGFVYVSGVYMNHSAYLIKLYHLNLNYIWGIKIQHNPSCSNKIQFKVKYNDIYLFNYIKDNQACLIKADTKDGCIKSSIQFDNITSYVVGDDLNVYGIYNGHIYIIKQYRKVCI